MNSLIRTENLSIIYNMGKSFEFPALLDVSIEIFSGEYIVFFGPSGCGKSTLLNCIAGLEKPVKGNIFIKNKNLTEYSTSKLVSYRRLNVGMIFQNYNLIPTLNILDNVTLPYILGGLHLSFAREKAKHLLEKFDIFELKKRYPSELSGGQRQRAAIARSLMYNPPIILADEPVGNLDSKSAEVVMNFLTEINEEKKQTIILVTHDPNYLKFPHRVFHMKDGRVVKETINPEKKQIAPLKKEEASENEYKVMSQEYPHLEEAQIKAKIILEHILHQYGIDTRQKIEKAITKYISGEINKEKMQEIFDLPPERGGANLYKQTAKKMADQVANLSSHVKLKERKSSYISPLREKVINISKILLDEYSGTLSFDQIERLKEALVERILGKIQKKKLKQFLDKPFSRGGVGLNRRTANDFTRKIEVILGVSKKIN